MLHFMQVDPINAALGRKVRDFREAHGWSQAELATRFGEHLGHPIDATAITRLEQGKRSLPVHELIPLSRTLGVEPTVFFKFLGPLDDLIAARELESDGLEARARVAAIEAEAAASQLEHLRLLQRYRDTGDLSDLSGGLCFLLTIARFDHPNWREILLDAGVPEKAISAALTRVKGAPGDDALGDVRASFIEAIFNATATISGRKRRKA